jgi:hypothetical protein
MLADKKLKRKIPFMCDNQEEAINSLYSEGVAMSMVFGENVYLCVIDIDKQTQNEKTYAIYEISSNGNIEKIQLSS